MKKFLIILSRIFIAAAVLIFLAGLMHSIDTQGDRGAFIAGGYTIIAFASVFFAIYLDYRGHKLSSK